VVIVTRCHCYPDMQILEDVLEITTATTTFEVLTHDAALPTFWHITFARGGIRRKASQSRHEVYTRHKHCLGLLGLLGDESGFALFAILVQQWEGVDFVHRILGSHRKRLYMLAHLLDLRRQRSPYW
jgi:hypothetical protein